MSVDKRPRPGAHSRNASTRSLDVRGGKAMKKILLATAFAGAQLATSLPAEAQAPAGDQDASQEFAEIVVTAERRRTDLQKTPIAATVLTGDAVANAGVAVVDQLQF